MGDEEVSFGPLSNAGESGPERSDEDRPQPRAVNGPGPRSLTVWWSAGAVEDDGGWFGCAADAAPPPGKVGEAIQAMPGSETFARLVLVASPLGVPLTKDAGRSVPPGV